jgi:RNA polymerase sigma-70 factor (ECF subfamily)
MSDAADAELLARLRRADDAAFREVIARYGPYLYGIARTLCQQQAEADDVVQETLAAMLTLKPRGEASLKTLLVSVLVRQAALARRRGKPWMRLVDSVGREGGRSPASSTPATGIEAGAASDAKMDLPVLLEALSPEHREVIILRELEQMSYEQMAEVLGIARGTVESRLHRAREHLMRLAREKM